MADTSSNMSKVQKTSKRHFLVLFALGGVLVSVGAIWSVKTTLFLMRAAEATGVVTKLKPSEQSSTWYATFTFTDAAGAPHTKDTWFLLSTESCPTFAEGDRVKVLYDPSSPDVAEIDSFPTLWVSPLFFSGLGVLFCLGAGIVTIARHAITRHQQQQTVA